MTSPITNYGFRDTLHDSEKPWYDAFVVTHKRGPASMWELMGWASNQQAAQRQFWEAVGI